MNKESIPRVYFGDFSIGNTPADGNNAFFDLCGCYDPVNNVVDSTLSGAFDVMNFLWFEGAESLFQDSSGMLFNLFSSPKEQTNKKIRSLVLLIRIHPT